MYKDGQPHRPGRRQRDTRCTWPPSAPTPRGRAARRRLERDSRRVNRKRAVLRPGTTPGSTGRARTGKYSATARRCTSPARSVHVPILLIDETLRPGDAVRGQPLHPADLPDRVVDRGQGRHHARRIAVAASPAPTTRSPRYRSDRHRAGRAGSGNRSDKVCPPVPKPNPTAGRMAVLARPANPGADRLPAALRAALVGRP